MTVRVRRRLWVVGGLIAVASIHASPVWASGSGGPNMPRNGPLQNLLDNLSGTTAQTLVKGE